jgi:hypothetical protein
MGGKQNYRIVIPTRDSERWIAIFGEAYRELGVEPLYIYDTRSVDGTLSELTRINAEIVPATPQHNRVEGIVPILGGAANADWVVRFDDDEFPSVQLIEWLNSSLEGASRRSLAISRRDATFVDGNLKYSRLEDYYFSKHDYAFLDPQWRAFRPAEVQFNGNIHAPGFLVDDDAWDFVPAYAFFVHFDWMVRSFAERLDKLRGYELQSPGAGWGLAQYYLPELHAAGDCRWTCFEDNQFDHLAERLRTITLEKS